MRIIHIVRKVLARLDGVLSRLDAPSRIGGEVPPRERYEEIRAFLRSLDLPNEGARKYLEIHLERIARTLTLVPPPGPSRRVLELGAYMQMTPALRCVLGYEEVRGAYYGSLGQVETKVITAGGEVFRCQIDLSMPNGTGSRIRLSTSILSSPARL